MAISVLNLGTNNRVQFTVANTMAWPLAPTPAPGSDLVITLSIINIGIAAVNTPTCTDNQGNTYTLVGFGSNTNAAVATSGAPTAAIFVATNIVSATPSVAGSFVVTVGALSGNRQTYVANHLELAGVTNAGFVDVVTTNSSGASQVSATTITGGSPNTQAGDIVIAVNTSSNPNNNGTSAVGPPATGYTDIMQRGMSSGSANTLDGGCDAAYKILTAIETSSATWTPFPNNAYSTAIIATLKPAITSISLPLSGQNASFTSGLLLASGGDVILTPRGLRRVPGPGLSPDYTSIFRGFQRNLSTQFPPNSVTVGLTGQPAVFGTGIVGLNLGGNVTLPLFGSQFTAGTGLLTASIGGDLTLALLGQGAVFMTGALLFAQVNSAIAQIATSGTFNNTIWDTRHVIDRAYGALRLKPQQITSEMIQIALDLLGLVLQDLVNNSAPLWTIDKVLVTLNQGQRAYTLPTATNDVDKALFRTLNDITPVSILSSPAAYTFDFGLNPDGSNSDSYVSSVSVDWTGNAVPILIQSSEDGISWANVGKSGVTQMGTGRVWYDVDVTKASRYWQIVPSSLQGLSINSAALYNTPSDVEMYRMNRDDYWNMTNKDFQGRPLQYWLDRQLVPQMQLWPSPDLMASNNVMVVYRKRYIMDVGSLQQTIEVPSRWYLAIIFSLAEALSWVTPEADPTVCEQVRPKADQMLRRAWLEERDRSPVKYNLSLRQYTR